MKVLVDSLAGKMGGARTYALNVIPLLGRLAPQAGFAAYVSEEIASSFEDVPENVEIRTAPRAEKSWGGHFWWQQVMLPGAIRRERFDVMYSAMNFGALRCPCRQVLLVRNPIYFDPLYYSRLPSGKTRLIIRARRALTVVSMKAADLSIFPTRDMLRRSNHYAGLPENRLRVIHYGFDPTCFKTAASSQPPEPVAKMRESAGFKLLVVAHLCDQKNYPTLFRAVAIAAKEMPDLKLYVAGEVAGWREFSGSPEERACRECPEGSVVFLGNLRHEHLGVAYAAASAFVFPSYLESFGHPMVEAMSFRLPVVAAGTAINREVCGNAALYHSVFDPEDLARRILRLAADEELRNNLSANARERAKRYTWKKHTARLLKALESSPDDERTQE